jgi:chromosome segregation ATPase
LEKDIGFQEKDDMIKSLQREIDELSSGGRERKNHEIVVDETSGKRQVSLEKLKAEHQEGDENIESLRDEISRLQTQVETLERDLRSTVKDRDRKWMEKDTEIESLKQKLEESENNAKQTNDAEIKSLKQKLEESENNAKQTNDAEVEQLKQELERSKKSTTQTKRKSIKVKQDKEAEIDALNETIQDLEAKLRKGQQSRKQVSGLKAKLDREMEQSAALVREKQAEIDILTADLQLANSRIGELGEKLRNDRERLSRKASKDDQRVSDLKDRLNEEMGHSESLKKQMETYKASLKAKRNIIDSQAYELRDSQDKLDTQESADRKTKRRMQQLEKEIWKMENELENVNSKIRSWRQMKHRHNNGGRDARGLYGDSIDNIPVTQYLDQFSKKVVNARRQLEAAQERMNRAG